MNRFACGENPLPVKSVREYGAGVPMKKEGKGIPAGERDQRGNLCLADICSQDGESPGQSFRGQQQQGLIY